MLVHRESGSLLLKVQQPELVKAVIPRHRDIAYEGHNLAVRFGIDEVRVLNNLGIRAPSPIQYFYDWPGRFRVLEHQQQTAALLTLYRRAFVLNETGCVDAATEYLTPGGWKRFDAYAPGDQVAQWNPATKAAEFVAPLEYVKKPCAQMIRFKTERGVDQLLSSEHRVAYITSTGALQVQPAHIIEARYQAAEKGWSGRFITTFNAKATGLELTDSQLQLMVAVIADGHFGSATTHCVIRLKKERKKERLRVLLANAAVSYKEINPEYESAKGFSIFKFAAPRRDKEFAAYYWAASESQRQLIAGEVVHWDGSERKNQAIEFSSVSKASVDFIQYCFASTGRTARVIVRKNNFRSTKPLYLLHARKNAALLYLKGNGPDTVWREPSPDGFKYCFEVPSDFLVLRRNGCIFVTGNTMKTASALWAADYLMTQGLVNKVLICAKLSTLERVWLEEIFNVLMHRSAVVLHDTREKRLEKLARPTDFYIVNHEGVELIADEVRRRKDIDLIIYDEASELRNAGTNKWKVMNALVNPAGQQSHHRLWLMTATPCPNAPTDAWALAKLVSPLRVPSHFNSWKRQTMLQVSQYKWVPKHESSTMAHHAMQPAVRFRKQDCLTLPPLVTEERAVPLSKEQVKYYNEMRIRMVIEDGIDGSGAISAANAADKITKLRQLLCGAIKHPDTGIYTALDHKPRLKVLLECIEEASAKVLVIVPFKGIIQVLAQELEAVYQQKLAAGSADAWKYKFAVLNGDVSPKNRNEIITAFKLNTLPGGLLCHPKVMAHGLNLTEADTTVFYAPIYSNDEFVQVIERFNRPGQTRKMTVIRMGAQAVPLEWNIYGALDGKQTGQMNILELYRQALEGVAA
jgi:hypothetical protein